MYLQIGRHISYSVILISSLSLVKSSLMVCVRCTVHCAASAASHQGKPFGLPACCHKQSWSEFKKLEHSGNCGISTWKWSPFGVLRRNIQQAKTKEQEVQGGHTQQVCGHLYIAFAGASIYSSYTLSPTSSANW